MLTIPYFVKILDFNEQQGNREKPIEITCNYKEDLLFIKEGIETLQISCTDPYTLLSLIEYFDMIGMDYLNKLCKYKLRYILAIH